ncbi:hypothetical protein [Curtanaerobium respiraculi]|uniref:hypothetical protein n=1 Tax=Curtanaerobium respiraculi TaxID=2949669 RepID=UPI0024B33E9D|nr:hypothetical protein [Curtanaerobium respiraculi]
MAAANPCLSMVSSLDADEFDALCSAVAERKRRQQTIIDRQDVSQRSFHLLAIGY